MADIKILVVFGEKMAKINNYTLEVLKPVSKEILKNVKKIKQDRNSMKIKPYDIMTLYIGVGLIPLVEDNNLLIRIKNMRSQIALETGIIIPSIRILDDLKLRQFEYSFFIKKKQIIKNSIKHNKYLCLINGNEKNKIEGIKTKDPVFKMPAILINKNQIKEAGEAGYTVVDTPIIIITHLNNIIKEHLYEIFTYDQSKVLLKPVAYQNPILVEDCYSKYKHIEIKEILSEILKKKGVLLNINKILELLLLYVDEKNNIDKITDLIIKEL